MSNPDDKLKHSKRLLKDENVIKKQTRIAKQNGMDVKEPHKITIVLLATQVILAYNMGWFY
jgi:hypothetical protein